MNRPGLQFFARPIDTVYTRVRPANYVYRPVEKPEWEPTVNELYIICQDGSVQSVFDSNLRIGWELVEQDNEWFYRLNQDGQNLRRGQVSYHATSERPPMGHGKTPAEYTEPDASDEPKIAQIGEVLGNTMADCCKAVNDPVQTDAMLKFSEGKLSYAEMRALCG